MNPGTAGHMLLAVLCGSLVLTDPLPVQAMSGGRKMNPADSPGTCHKKATHFAVNRSCKELNQRYVSGSYPGGSLCLTYPTYQLPAPPTIFSYGGRCPSRNIYHPDLRTSRLVYPGAIGAYDLYYYNWTDPLDQVTAPFVAAAWPIKALSRPVPEAAPVIVPLAASRSIAAGPMKHLCSTPVKSCQPKHAAFTRNTCFCRKHGRHPRVP